MRAWHGPAAWAVLAVLAATACVFEPDLSRFPSCDEQGGCEAGWTCLAQVGRCLPDCGALGPCTSPGAGGESEGGQDGGPDSREVIALVNGELAPALEGARYAHSFQARGGVPPYQFSLTPGSRLPEGLVLSAAGELSGTPSVAGTFPIHLTVEDEGTPRARASIQLSLHIRPLLRLAGPPVLAEALVGQPYTEVLSATGGTPPYHFSLAPSNTLPTGLTLAEDGTLTGTVQQASTSSFLVQVRDSEAQETSRSLSLTSIVAPLTLRMTSQSVPDGRAGTPYTYTLKHSGGSGSLKWTLEAGLLPPGLTLDASTGLLSGTPSSAGTFAFTLSVADSVSSDRRTLSLQVY